MKNNFLLINNNKTLIKTANLNDQLKQIRDIKKIF